MTTANDTTTPMQLRKTNLKKLQKQSFDVLIVGGGINGAVAAAALAQRGVKVALIDQEDFAGMTSQESSNLAWGGIKYMENMEFALVRKLCKSRNHLLRHYPSTVQEIRFFTTIEKGFRLPAFLIYLGTWLYWCIGSCFTKIPRYLSRAKIESEEPVINTSKAQGGFEYSDAYLYDNDARFVFGFVRSALTAGAAAVNYLKLTKLVKEEQGLWRAEVADQIDAEQFSIRAKVVINATGPLADKFNAACKQKSNYRLALSKGIHLLVNRVTESKKVLAFFASDGRLFFVIPMGSRTCIGTTDTPVDGPTKEVTDEDRDFVLQNINALLNLQKPLTTKDIIADRCGVRPLVITDEASADADWMQLSRKHIVEVDERQRYLTIFGGKLTDCINVGEEICDSIDKMGITIPFPDQKWYGEPSADSRERFMHQARLMDLDALTSAGVSEKLSTRLWRRYGIVAFELLEMIENDPTQAEVLIKGTEYLRCELQETANREMVTKLSDFLRRRSKIAQIERRETILNSAGLLEACQILFGDQAEEKLREYEQETAGRAWNDKESG